MIFNVSTAKANTDLEPDPDAPLENAEWGFELSDVIGWEVNYYQNDRLIGKDLNVYNISSITYEKIQSAPFNDNMGYKVEFWRMFWNSTFDKLEQKEDQTENFNAFNFSNGEEMFHTEGDDPFFVFEDLPVPLVLPLPQKSTPGIDQTNMTYYANIYNETLSRDPDYDSVSVIDTGKNQMNFTLSGDSYINLTYDDHGILYRAEFKFEDDDELEIVVTRTEDFCPVNDVEWSVEKNDEIYFGINTDDYKIDIVDIYNYTENGEDLYFDHFVEWEETCQVVAANKSIWDSENEEWDLLESWENDKKIVGFADDFGFYYNEYYLEDLFMIPRGSTGTDLVGDYYEIMTDFDNYNFEELEYGDLWVYMENPATGEHINYTFFPDGDNEGIVKNWYKGFDVEYYNDYNQSDFGFSRGDQFIYEIATLDENGLEYFFEDWEDTDILQLYLGGAQVNSKQKIEVWSIEEESGPWGGEWDICYNIWDWTLGNFDVKHNDDDDVGLNKDPGDEDQEDPPMWFSPKPVQSYLDGLDFGGYSNWQWFRVGSNELNASSSDLGEETFNISIGYDPDLGVVDKFQILNNTGVYFELQLTEYIPYTEVPDNTTLLIWKNVTFFSEGEHTNDYHLGGEFEFTVELELNCSTSVGFTAYYESPQEDEDLDDSVVYFDLFFSNHSAIEFPINITVELPATSNNVVLLYYNDTTGEWEEETNYVRVGDTLIIQLEHASLFSIAEGSGGVILTPSDSDDDDDDDKEEMIPFGNFYLLFIAIGIIGLVFYTKRKNFKKL